MMSWTETMILSFDLSPAIGGNCPFKEAVIVVRDLKTAA
jgi:hypothetical protein